VTADSEHSWVEVARFRDTDAADQHALVLVAAGIDCQIVADDGPVAIRVEAANAAKALAELAAYSADNRRLVPVPLNLRPPRAGLAGTLVYCCVLLFVYGASERGSPATGWWPAMRMPVSSSTANGGGR